MLSAIPSQYHLFIGIGGLVFLMLFIISAAHKYQAYQMEKEAALRRMLRGVQQVERVLSLIEGCSVPLKLQILLRKEILARYMAMRHIHKRLENINHLINMSQQGLAAAEAKADANPASPKDRQTLNQYVSGITELISFLNTQGHIAGMNELQRKKYQSDLSSLRADFVSDFHVLEAKALSQQQLWDEASKHLREAMQYFQNHGPATDHIQKLYNQANQYYKQVMSRQVPGSPPNQPPLDEGDTVAQAADTAQ